MGLRRYLAPPSAFLVTSGGACVSFPARLDRGLTAFSAYGVVPVPTTVLVTADGTISAALSSYPIAGREEFFDQVEAAVGVRTTVRPARPLGREPDPRAVRYFNLGRALMARGLADQAALELRRAIELDASFSLPRILLGQLHREQAMLRVGIQYEGRTISTVQVSNQERDRLLRDAQAQLDEAVKIDPASPAALTELALVHRARGDRAGARALLQRALIGETMIVVMAAGLAANLTANPFAIVTTVTPRSSSF